MFLKYNPVSQSILCWILLMNEVTTHLNYSTQEPKKTIHICDIEMSQGLQTWYEMVDPNTVLRTSLKISMKKSMLKFSSNQKNVNHFS